MTMLRSCCNRLMVRGDPENVHPSIVDCRQASIYKATSSGMGSDSITASVPYRPHCTLTRRFPTEVLTWYRHRTRTDGEDDHGRVVFRRLSGARPTPFLGMASRQPNASRSCDRL